MEQETMSFVYNGWEKAQPALEILEKRKRESKFREGLKNAKESMGAEPLKWYEFPDDEKIIKATGRKAGRKMELLEQLELVEVQIKDGKVIMTFLDEERGEIREVNFNKNVYDEEKNEWIPNEKKAEQCEEWALECFGLKFDHLAQAIGVRKDVYTYPNFNSLWFVDYADKFETDQVGLIFQTNIKSIEDDGKAILIKFDHEDKTYQSKMSYAEYMESRAMWFVNPQKKTKQFAKFESKFLVPFEEKESLIGVEIMVEVKLAFSKFVYCEIKPFPKASKKKK